METLPPAGNQIFVQPAIVERVVSDCSFDPVTQSASLTSYSLSTRVLKQDKLAV